MDTHTKFNNPFQRKKPPSDLIDRTTSNLDEKHENALPGELISAGSQHLHRKIGGKELQLFAVGGAIGTCMQFSKGGCHSKLLHRWFDGTKVAGC